MIGYYPLSRDIYNQNSFKNMLKEDSRITYLIKTLTLSFFKSLLQNKADTRNMQLLG